MSRMMIQTALGFFNRMQLSGVKPDWLTLVSLASIIAQLSDAEMSRSVHGFILRRDWFREDVVLEMQLWTYDALSLFYQVPRMSSGAWNTIISCLGVHGHGEKAVKLFKDMIDEGVKPDHVTFVSLMAACSHSDLLGRAGHLNKAYSFIKKMPVQPDASVWGALLGACRIHGNAELGKIASEGLFEVDSENMGYYVLLSIFTQQPGNGKDGTCSCGDYW
ncbi:hypothetical protein M0R45_007771 [Rubus argutus]|uniref:Pentatricopeptide repeat-containing protein n=1 Tax=Rubus argutus TaxID=59490 RepID=A0AAW1XZQ0_RUBAR